MNELHAWLGQQSDERRVDYRPTLSRVGHVQTPSEENRPYDQKVPTIAWCW